MDKLSPVNRSGASCGDPHISLVATGNWLPETQVIVAWFQHRRKLMAARRLCLVLDRGPSHGGTVQVGKGYK